MLAQISPLSFGAPTVDAPSTRVVQGAPPGKGETAAAAMRPESVQRVDPPRVLMAAPPIPERELRKADLIPPDPDAPTGPPPTFDATLLERQFERISEYPRQQPKATFEPVTAPETVVREGLVGEADNTSPEESNAPSVFPRGLTSEDYTPDDTAPASSPRDLAQTEFVALRRIDASGAESRLNIRR